MIDLDEATRATGATQRFKLIEAADGTLRNGDRLFDAKDPWYKDAVKLIENYRTEQRRWVRSGLCCSL